MRVFIMTTTLLAACGGAASQPPDPVVVSAPPAASTTAEETGPSVTPEPTVRGNGEQEGDGSSCDQAVVIHADNESEGVRAEYAWLEQHYPGYQRKSQALIQCGERPADQLSIVTADGESIDVYFDISEYFGKF